MRNTQVELIIECILKDIIIHYYHDYEIWSLYRKNLYKVKKLFKGIKKDIWNPQLFGFGIIEFPPGKVTENKFWITTKKLNCRKKSILFRIEDKLQKSESEGQF